MKRYLMALLMAVAGVLLLSQSSGHTVPARAAGESNGLFYLPVIFHSEREEFDMERYVREALLMPIIGGSSAIQKNNIANRLRLARE